MKRMLLCAAAIAALAGCRTYDRQDRVSTEKGLADGARFARYGKEQAEKIAIGRKYAEAEGSRGERATTAMTYAKTLPDVVSITADTLGGWLTVTFKSGWRVAVLPVNDGTKAEATPGLPAAAPRAAS